MLIKVNQLIGGPWNYPWLATTLVNTQLNLPSHHHGDCLPWILISWLFAFYHPPVGSPATENGTVELRCLRPIAAGEAGPILLLRWGNIWTNCGGLMMGWCRNLWINVFNIDVFWFFLFFSLFKFTKGRECIYDYVTPKKTCLKLIFLCVWGVLEGGD